MGKRKQEPLTMSWPEVRSAFYKVQRLANAAPGTGVSQAPRMLRELSTLINILNDRDLLILDYNRREQINYITQEELDLINTPVNVPGSRERAASERQRMQGQLPPDQRWDD